MRFPLSNRKSPLSSLDGHIRQYPMPKPLTVTYESVCHTLPFSVTTNLGCNLARRDLLMGQGAEISCSIKGNHLQTEPIHQQMIAYFQTPQWWAMNLPPSPLCPDIPDPHITLFYDTTWCYEVAENFHKPLLHTPTEVTLVGQVTGPQGTLVAEIQH